MKIIKTFNIVLVLLALSALPAHAGWVETNQQQEVTYFGNGIVKSVLGPEAEEPEMIMNFDRGTVTLVNHGSRTFTSFRLEKFCDYLKGMFSAYPPDMLAGLKQHNESQPKPKVSTSRIGKGGTIAGFATTKYRVINNGQLNRTVWIAEDARLKKYTGAHFSKFMDGAKKMTTCVDLGMSGEKVDTSPAYFKLMKSGWLMKEELVNEDGMEGSSAPVVKLVEKNLPASTFSVPKGYRKVPLAQFNMGN
ncbi:hypothetical protein BMS3Abin14_02237 [bacterium BMS3Abin14]|nr:hypothetical protein BMS3Abin14_02237 [bacterium BMS3Abin14]